MKKRLLLLVVSVMLIGLNGWSQATQNRSSKAALETELFYFDNPDGTIEAYPEYNYRGLEQRMMSISSSKYATPLKGEPQGALKKYEKVFNLLFGRQTRTTVFVFDGQESAKGGMMTSTIYSSSILGLWAAMEEGMREQVGAALDDAHIAHTTSATWRDALKMGKPEEVTFNGHEGGHFVNRMDLSNSWLSLMAAANVEMVFDNYFYYDQEYDKIVCVVFTYSEISNPKGKYAAAAYTAIKAISAASGYLDPTTGNTTLASMFERRDMIDYFKKHFHLKKPTTPAPPKCIATFTGTPQEPKIDLCGTEHCIGIDCWLIDSIPEIRIREPQPPQPPRHGDPPVKPQQHSTKKFAIIKQADHPSHPLVENDQYVYILQSQYADNAVIAIDKETGEVTEVVPSKKKGDRPDIISMGAHGNDLYLDVKGRGIVRYDGKSLTTSELIVEVERGFLDMFNHITLSPNGRYLAYGNSSKTCVYDLQDHNKLIKEYYDGLTDYIVTDNGDLFGTNNYRTLVVRNNGNVSDSDPETTETSAAINGDPCQLYQDGEYIYLVGGSKVAKTKATEFKWEVSADLTGSFKMNAAGISAVRGFAYIQDNSLNRFAEFTISANEVKLQKLLNTGIRIPPQKSALQVSAASNIHIDSNGNIWMLDNAGNGCYIVYNPSGIVGLKAIAGKFKEVK